jgi:hypothetical protein
MTTTTGGRDDDVVGCCFVDMKIYGLVPIIDLAVMSRGPKIRRHVRSRVESKYTIFEPFLQLWLKGKL